METPVLKDYLHPGCRIVVAQNTVFTTRFGDVEVPKGAKGELVSFRSLFRKNHSDVLIKLDGASAPIFVPVEHIVLDPTHIEGK